MPRIIERLHRSPENAHQLAAHLGLDYRTGAPHHLLLLERNGAVARQLRRRVRGPQHELSPYLAEHFQELKGTLFERAGSRSVVCRGARLPGTLGAIR